MNLRSRSFRPYDHLDPRLAFGTWDPDTHVKFAGNRNPHLVWDDVPADTKSFVVLVWDVDVPTEGSKVNREGVTVPVDLPRADFFHWVMVDLPPALREIAEGSHSDGVVPHGKPLGATPSGGLHGLNDYTGWFAGNPDMSGDYAGYDGPGPPWNDERVHGYRFTVYALDVPMLGLSGRFTGPEVRQRMAPHVLAQAQLVGLYAINPEARQR